jgi:hypothetical protein
MSASNTNGYEHKFINQFADFMVSLEGGPKFPPDMRGAMRTQRVCESVLEILDFASRGV